MNLDQPLISQMKKQRPREGDSVPESHKENEWQDPGPDQAPPDWQPSAPALPCWVKLSVADTSGASGARRDLLRSL